VSNTGNNVKCFDYAWKGFFPQKSVIIERKNAICWLYLFMISHVRVFSQSDLDVNDFNKYDSSLL
jgi:hypothetical protein